MSHPNAKYIKTKGSRFKGKPEKSWNELGIPSDRVAPGAPNPPPPLGELHSDPLKKSKPKMRHGRY